MSDNNTSIVPKLTNYPDRLTKANIIIDWLVSREAIKPIKTGCVLSEDLGYPIGEGAKSLVNEPQYLPYNLLTCGLAVITKNCVFDAGENGIDSFVCPNCAGDILSEPWDLNDFYENGNPDLICPLCNQLADLNNYQIEPAWGFSNLGFTFWNWPPLKDSFIAEFEQRLGCEVKVVEGRI